MSERTILRIAAILFALLGGWILWNSTAWGVVASFRVSASFPFGISGEHIKIIQEGPVIALRILGAIILSVGLFRALQYPPASQDSR